MANAVVFVQFAFSSREAVEAAALESVDDVVADAAVQARVGLALVDVHLAVDARVTRHADASESASLVETGAVVLARIGVALVDVDLAPGSGKSAGAVASEGARSVDAGSSVLARQPLRTFVHVFGAVDPFEADGTGTHVGAVYGTRVADGPLVARVAGTGVIQVTQ